MSKSIPKFLGNVVNLISSTSGRCDTGRTISVGTFASFTALFSPRLIEGPRAGEKSNLVSVSTPSLFVLTFISGELDGPTRHGAPIPGYSRFAVDAYGI